jgi:hypothetical protein
LYGYITHKLAAPHHTLVSKHHAQGIEGHHLIVLQASGHFLEERLLLQLIQVDLGLEPCIEKMERLILCAGIQVTAGKEGGEYVRRESLYTKRDTNLPSERYT